MGLRWHLNKSVSPVLLDGEDHIDPGQATGAVLPAVQ